MVAGTVAGDYRPVSSPATTMRFGTMGVKQLVTAEELWALPEKPGVRYELVAGELVEAPAAGALHNLIAALVYELLRAFVREHDLGLVFTVGMGYILDRDPDLL